MSTVHYPGYMEPWSAVAVDLKEAATTTFYPTGDQVDCGYPDPDPFDYYAFEPGTAVAVDLKEAATTSYFPTGDQLDCGDPDPDAFEYTAFEPGYPAAAASISVVPVDLNSYGADFPSGDQSSTEIDPEPFEFHFKPIGDVITDVITSVLTDSPDYELEQPDVSGPDADPFEFAFEPWTDQGAAALINAGDGDYADLFIDEPDATPFGEWNFDAPLLEIFNFDLDTEIGAEVLAESDAEYAFAPWVSDEATGTGELVSGDAELSGQGTVSSLQTVRHGGGQRPVVRIITTARGQLLAPPATMQGHGNAHWNEYNTMLLLLLAA